MEIRKPLEIRPEKKPKSKALWGIIAIFAIGGLLLWSPWQKKAPTEILLQTESGQVEEKVEKQTEKFNRYIIQEGDIPADVFAKQGNLSANEIEKLLAASQEIYDFSKLRIGQAVRFYFETEGETTKIEYDLGTESKIVAKKTETGFETSKEKIDYQTEEKIAHVEIDEFLYKDALDAGMSEASVLEIADIFSFDVDFTTEIQAGDKLTVIYEKRTLDGAAAPDGKILAAKFTNVGQEYFGYYFPGTEDDGGHYDAEGHELLRQFLRAPLSYRQITSGYTGARMHPITKTVTAHYQIDYAAAVGTPVVATARGTVASAGWEGGWGNMIRLKHDNGYSTHYGHLSGFAKGIRAGGSVSQGQVIGYVGSTGWSTGPHLDYGMKLNGSPINPLSLKLPKGTPLEGAALAEFEKIKEKYAKDLN